MSKINITTLPGAHVLLEFHLDKCNIIRETLFPVKVRKLYNGDTMVGIRSIPLFFTIIKWNKYNFLILIPLGKISDIVHDR